MILSSRRNPKFTMESKIVYLIKNICLGRKKNFPPHIFVNGKYTVLTKCFSRWSGWQRKIQSGAKMMFSVPIMTMSQKKPMDAIMGPEIAGPLQSSEYSHIRKIFNMQNRHTLYKHVYLVFWRWTGSTGWSCWG